MRLILLILVIGYIIYAFLSNDGSCQCDHDCEFCPFPPCDESVHKKKDLR